MKENYDLLYLFGYSPRTGKELERLLAIVEQHQESGLQVGMVLIHDGVVVASSIGKQPEEVKRLRELSIGLHVMIPDLQARGLSLDHLEENIQGINYEELVELLDNAQKIISWM